MQKINYPSHLKLCFVNNFPQDFFQTKSLTNMGEIYLFCFSRAGLLLKKFIYMVLKALKSGL